ncbi:hypothetical protein [Sphingomonas abaci]|uniref:Uncharacterized protein n=1 Tax=Sphingomonas abaci TaxID=237611 RepID=A0A7W7AMQ7_9SPHN|nr:hypothetical protein [Sphingomonas abaci]MBB4619912.1 hypothetical protein [Sphingomonas abaci]
MTINLSETIAFNEGLWKDQVSASEALAASLAAAVADAEARVAALEGAGPPVGAYLLDAPAPTAPPSASGVNYRYIDSTGADHYAEASFAAADIAARLYVGGDANGNRYRLRTNDTKHFYLSVQTAAQAATDGDDDATDLNGFSYNNLPTGANLSTDDPISIRFSFIKRVLRATYNEQQLFSVEVDKLNLATAASGNKPLTLPPSGAQYAGAAQRNAISNAALRIKQVDVVGGNPPLTINSARLVTGFKPQTTITYTGTGVSYLGQLESGSGGIISAAQPVDVIENSVAGTATVQSKAGIPLQFAGQVVTFRLIEQRNGAASGVTATNAQTRGAGMSFTTNLLQDSDGYQHSGLSNRLGHGWRNNIGSTNRSLRDWGEDSPELNRKGEPTAAAIQAVMAENTSGGDGTGKGPITMIRAPYVPGERTRVWWTGKQTDAEILYMNNNIGNPVAGTDGTRSWIDFAHNFDPLELIKPGTHDNLGVWFRITKPSGTYPSGFEAFPIDSQGNRLQKRTWDERYVAHLKRLFGVQPGMTVPLLPVALRPMDLLSQIGYNNIPLSADKVPYRGERGSRGGYSFETILDLYEDVGVGGWMLLPLQADESYVRAVAARCAAWCVQKMLFLLFEGAGNEGWNSFQSAYHALQAMYESQYPGKETNENARALKMQGIISTQQMIWVKSEFDKVPGATKYLLRGCNFQNANIANARNLVATAHPDFKANHDVYMTAPYIAGGMAKDLPQTYPASDATMRTFVDRAKAHVPLVYADAKKFQTWAKEDEKLYIPYEGFIEDTGSGGVITTLKQSAYGTELTEYMASFWRDNNGGPFGLYYDLSNGWGVAANMCQIPELASSTVPPASMLIEMRRQVDAAVAAAISAG